MGTNRTSRETERELSLHSLPSHISFDDYPDNYRPAIYMQMMAARALPVASKRSSRVQQKAARSLGSLKRSQDMDNSFTVIHVTSQK